MLQLILTSSQAPSYASPKLRLTDLLTGVKCRATSVAKNYMNECLNIFVRLAHQYVVSPMDVGYSKSPTPKVS